MNAKNRNPHHRLLLLLTLLLLQTLLAWGQQRGTGLIVDDDIENKIPKKTRLLTRSYTTLPKSWSLRQYCPVADDQGIYQTCVGWATAYAARTICEAVKNGWKNTDKNTAESFSPLFVYGNIKHAGTQECNMGTTLDSAMKLLKNTGVVKKKSFDVMCVDFVSTGLNDEAKKYKIDDYFLLFGPNHTYEDAVSKTKKAISENCPVVISFQTFNSFKHKGFDCWNGDASGEYGYHAMCVVGYDDSMYGGAFQLMNSWSKDWGTDGFAWIRYNDYHKYVHDATELYLNPATTEKTTTVSKNKFGGSVSLRLSTGETLGAKLATSGGIKCYRVTESLVSGTRYRIYLGNQQPGYVYVFSSDQQNNVAINFPTDSLTTAALTYSSNDIALPGETSWLELDDTRGTDYLCILYSKYSVDVSSLLNYLKTAKGSFYQKVKSGFKKYLCPQGDIKYGSGNISFSATSTKAIVPVFIEFKHL